MIKRLEIVVNFALQEFGCKNIGGHCCNAICIFNILISIFITIYAGNWTFSFMN